MNRSFSSDQLNAICRKLRGNEEDQFNGLETLSNLLIYGAGEQFSSLPCQDVSFLVTKILHTTRKDKTREMAALCVYHILIANPLSHQYFFQANILDIFQSIMKQQQTKEF